MVVVEDLLQHGWLFLHLIYSNGKLLEQCMTHILGFFGICGWTQEVSSSQNWSFCLEAGPTLVDMHKIGLCGHLTKMWHGDELFKAKNAFWSQSKTSFCYSSSCNFLLSLWDVQQALHQCGLGACHLPNLVLVVFTYFKYVTEKKYFKLL